MSTWMKKGDKVVVISGNEKGRSGTVQSLKGNYVVITGLNIRKKHVRPKSRASQGIIELEMPIHISNVSLCDSDGKPLKLKVKVGKEGQKQLVYSAGNKEVVHRQVKKSNEK